MSKHTPSSTKPPTKPTEKPPELSSANTTDTTDTPNTTGTASTQPTRSTPAPTSSTNSTTPTNEETAPRTVPSNEPSKTASADHETLTAPQGVQPEGASTANGQPTHTDPALGVPCAIEGEPGLYVVDLGYSINTRKTEGDAATALKLPEGYRAVRIELHYAGVAGKGITAIRGPSGLIAMSAPVMVYPIAGTIQPGDTIVAEFETAPGILPSKVPNTPDTERESRGDIYLIAEPA